MLSKNEVVKSRFDWGVVAASCIASLCGCYLAVELLHRRSTGVRSKRSWLVFAQHGLFDSHTNCITRVETVTCAICLGLIGIWCMHFIGNRAIILGDGSDDLQLVYNPGFSVLSALLPIIILVIAFALQELQYRSRKHRSIALVVTGICSGLSVVGMHYVGNLGISNYHLHYPPGFFAASFIIAVADCLTVMGLFYTWRERWISHW
jgi:NO-binding membrane sensor protein with MHYT domain